MIKITTLLAAVLGLVSSSGALALTRCQLDGYLGIDSISVSPLSRTQVRVTVVDDTGGVYRLPFAAEAMLAATIELDAFNVFNDVAEPALVKSRDGRWCFRSYESRAEILHPIVCE